MRRGDFQFPEMEEAPEVSIPAGRSLRNPRKKRTGTMPVGAGGGDSASVPGKAGAAFPYQTPAQAEPRQAPMRSRSAGARRALQKPSSAGREKDADVPSAQATVRVRASLSG
jgi:hypothetical protein